MPTVALVALAVIFALLYISLTLKPLEYFVLTPSVCPDAWSYSLSDGSSVEPDESGSFPELGAGETLYCSTVLTDEISSSALLMAASTRCDIAVYIDGELVGNISRTEITDGGFAEDKSGHSSTGYISLNDAAGRTLTLAVRFSNGQAELQYLPTVELYPDILTYNSQALSAAANSALPAGVFLAVAIFLGSMAVFRMWRDQAEWGLLLTAGAALGFCLSSSITYSHYALFLTQSASIIWLTATLPSISLLWMLWLHTNGIVKKVSFFLPLAATAICVFCVISAIFGLTHSVLMNLLKQKLLPLFMLLLLCCGAYTACSSTGWYRQFFKFGCGIFVIIVGWAVISFATDGALAKKFVTAVNSIIEYRSYFGMLEIVDDFILATVFILSINDFINAISSHDTEIQALKLQKSFSEANAEALRSSLDDTRIMRHEFHHHVEALAALCGSGEWERVCAYVQDIRGAFDPAPAIYTDNIIINSIVSLRLRRAREEGIDVTAKISVPENVGIEDADLSVFMTNLLENAAHAAASVRDPARRRLYLSMGVYNGRLVIYCENTYDGTLKFDGSGSLLSSRQESGHGYGLRLMRRVAARYDSIVGIKHENGVFSVSANLLMGNTAET